jgi:transposase-like protein
MNKEIQPDKWSNEEKFSVVLETSALAEVELNEYCRAKGLYPEQVKRWKQACIEGNKQNPVKKAKDTAEQKSDKKQIKALERELHRKDKALAEAAALIVLGKKYDAYWKEKEDN